LAKGSREQLDGITLSVYLHVVRKRKPVGPRDVMKAMNLSSPSVAYRHLQKLEDLGYLEKNEFGEYTMKNKAHIAGYLWIGRRLMPKMWIYSIVFLGILLFEFYVLVEHLPYENYEFKDFFTIIMLITGAALAVFTVEGFLQNRRKPWPPTE
jgi:hypothetical protein